MVSWSLTRNASRSSALRADPTFIGDLTCEYESGTGWGRAIRSVLGLQLFYLEFKGFGQALSKKWFSGLEWYCLTAATWWVE